LYDSHVKTNIGDADRVARLMSGATVGFLFARLRVDETIHTSLGLLSLYLLATALFAWGPFYALFRYSTRKPTDAQSTVKKVD